MSKRLLQANNDRPSYEGLYYVRLHETSTVFLVEVYKHGEFLYAKTLGKRDMDPTLFNKVHSERTTRIHGTWWGPLEVPDIEG